MKLTGLLPDALARVLRASRRVETAAREEIGHGQSMDGGAGLNAPLYAACISTTATSGVYPGILVAQKSPSGVNPPFTQPPVTVVPPPGYVAAGSPPVSLPSGFAPLGNGTQDCWLLFNSGITPTSGAVYDCRVSGNTQTLSGTPLPIFFSGAASGGGGGGPTVAVAGANMDPATTGFSVASATTVQMDWTHASLSNTLTGLLTVNGLGQLVLNQAGYYQINLSFALQVYTSSPAGSVIGVDGGSNTIVPFTTAITTRPAQVQLAGSIGSNYQWISTSWNFFINGATTTSQFVYQNTGVTLLGGGNLSLLYIS